MSVQTPRKKSVYRFKTRPYAHQKEALRKQLSYESRAACSQRQSYSDLATAIGRARQQQISQIGAGQ